MGRLGWVAVMVVGLVVGLAGSAGAADVPFVFDGWVDGVAPGGSFTYVGGSFSRELYATGGGAIVSPSGEVRPGSTPPIAGNVTGAVSDGAGGWYVSGFFDSVGGMPSGELAHIRADGSVDRDFAPSVGWTSWTPVPVGVAGNAL